MPIIASEGGVVVCLIVLKALLINHPVELVCQTI